MSDTGDRQVSLWPLWCSQCIAIAGLTVIVPHLPLYIKELEASPEAVQWWSSLCLLAPACTQFFSAPIWGHLGDRWSRKWMIIRALFGLALIFAIMSIVQTSWQFLLCRLLQGICGGVVEANVAFAISQAKPEQSGRVLGRLNGATAAGSLLGPVLGSLLAVFWGYKILFLLTGIALALCAIWTTLTLQEHRSPTKEDTTASQSPSLKAICYALLRNRTIQAVLLLGICVQAGIYGFVGTIALHIDALLQNPQSTGLWVGGLQAVTWGTTLVSSSWWGRHNDRSHVGYNLGWAAIGCGIAIFLQGFVPFLLLFILLRLAQGFFFSALVPSMYLCVRQQVPQDHYSSSIGIVSSVLVCGQIIGPLFASLLSLTLPLSWVIGCMGLFYLAGAAYLFYTLLSTRGQKSMDGAGLKNMGMWKALDKKEVLLNKE